MQERSGACCGHLRFHQNGSVPRAGNHVREPGVYLVSCSGAAAGGLTRAEGQDRIDLLAQVRNAALEPLRNGSALTE